MLYATAFIAKYFLNQRGLQGAPPKCCTRAPKNLDMPLSVT